MKMPRSYERVTMNIAQINMKIAQSLIGRWAFQDAQTVSQVRASHDLSQLQLGSVARGIHDPCSGITCAANLKCPTGFSVTKVAGHCCPYCVNPDIKVEAAMIMWAGDSGRIELGWRWGWW